MGGCPILPSVDLVPFFRIERVPAFCNLLWPTREQALAAAHGEIRLGYCPQTGLVWNLAFDPRLLDYSPDYEASLHFSPRFREYAAALCARLVAKHGLAGKDVVEIGCGKGEFLRLLCAAGARGLGFDRGYDAAPDDPFRVIRTPFDAGAADHEADLVCCRHVLEHVAEPLTFLAGVRRLAARRPDAGVFFEVPNGLWTLRDLGIWDILYEHVAYFTAASLTRLFTAAGFDVDDVWTDFGDQFLCIEGRPAEPRAPAPPDAAVAEVVALCRRFAARFDAKREHWERELGRLLGAGRVALWGAGSKGITFLNTVAGGPEVGPVVDLNPRKQGRFVPGTGQQVAVPEALLDARPGRVLVMNPVYAGEISGRLVQMGLDAEVSVV